SEVTVATLPFELKGSYQVTGYAVDYDADSSKFGSLSGYINAEHFNVEGTGLLGTFHLILDNNQPFEVNLLPAWNALDLTTISLDFDVLVSGRIEFNGLFSPFSGRAYGKTTYGSDFMERYDINLELLSGFGSVTGMASSVGKVGLESVPEAGAIM